MSQNAILDREAVSTTGETTTAIAPSAETLPYTRTQREHLSLVDWDLTAPTILARNFAPVRPARRAWFGWTEACVGLLMLASGAAAIASLLNL